VPEWKRSFGRLRSSGGIVLNLLHRNRTCECVLHSNGTGQGPMAGACELGNEPSDFIKGEECLHQPCNDHIFKEKSARRRSLGNLSKTPEKVTNSQFLY
jgi:hypothetical protein